MQAAGWKGSKVVLQSAVLQLSKRSRSKEEDTG